MQKWFGGSKLFDVKPFSCAPCLSFWIAVILTGAYLVGQYFDTQLILNFEVLYKSVLTLAGTYLAAEILIIYESK